MKYRLGMLLIWLMCVAASVISLTWLLLAILAGSERAWCIAIGIDQSTNAATGGDPDETISSRCWRYREVQPYRALRWLIDKAAAIAGEANHCQASYDIEWDRARERWERYQQTRANE
jgi:hypothetical protein